MVLTTCNRAEIYVACEDTEATRRGLERFMSRFHDVPEHDLAAIPVRRILRRSYSPVRSARQSSVNNNGWSYHRIAEELTQRGIPTKTGNVKWIHTAVRRILTRPAGWRQAVPSNL